MKKPILTILAFMFVSFGVQGLSHFVINADHFASITFMRPDPVLPMGFAAMIIEALIFSFVMARLRAKRDLTRLGGRMPPVRASSG